MLKPSFIALVFIVASALVHAEPPATVKDDNGMQTYYVGFLSRGERWTPE